MHILTKDQLLAAQGRRYVVLDIPELGGQLRLASLSYGRMIAFNKLQGRNEAGEDVKTELATFLLCTMVVDGVGRTLLTEEDAKAFTENVSVDTMMHIMREATQLMSSGAPKKDAEPVETPKVEEPPAGNPVASQTT